MATALQLNTYEDEESAEIIRECMEHGRALGPVSIAKAASRQGASLKWLTAGEAWAILHDRRIVISGNHATESALAATTVTDKQLTKELLALRGIPVPAGRQVSSPEDAIQAQQELGLPVVIKPLNGAMGHGAWGNCQRDRA